MTDLSIALPAFPAQEYAHLIPSLEKGLITTTDLISLDPVDIAKRAQLPVLDVKRLCNAVLQELQRDLGIGPATEGGRELGHRPSTLKKTGDQIVELWSTISTLDEAVDEALRGGIPTGYITEITGESGAGKTQFLLGLLLATQLPAPHGLSRSALYISTESALPTTRLSQMLKEHPLLASIDPKPSLDRVISIVTPDLESQDHILRYQLPVAIRRHGVGLVVLDSVAANYRAEFERPGASKNGANMAKRSSELVKLGQLLRDLARTENIAIVVANQVADRFTSPESRRVGASGGLLQQTQSSPLAYRSGGAGAGRTPTRPPSHYHHHPHHPPSSIPAPPPSSGTTAPPTPAFRSRSTETMTLDHQQRWFTGWGDDRPDAGDLKTPSLGLTWTTQIACRIALIKSPVYAGAEDVDDDGGAEEVGRGGGERVLKGWRRWAKIVFAPWTAPSGVGVEGAVEFAITGAGIKAVVAAPAPAGVNVTEDEDEMR